MGSADLGPEVGMRREAYADGLFALLDATFGEDRERWRHHLLRRALAHPWVMLRVLGWAARLPTVSFDVPDTLAGGTIRASLHIRARGLPTGMLARAVLEIPSDGTYRRGRSRQALRTNVRRATAEGIRVERLQVNDSQPWVTEIVRCRGHDGELNSFDGCPEGSTLVWVAFQDATPLAYLIAVVCEHWALLWEGHATENELGSDARWLVHAEMVDDLARQGVEYLLVGSALRLSPGLRAFQRMTGFRAVNLRLAEQRQPTPVHIQRWVLRVIGRASE